MSPFAKILVFGKNGQLARSFAEVFKNSKIHFISQQDLDLRHSVAIVPFVTAQNPTLVINAAAYTQVDLAETQKSEAESVNAVAPKMLAMACESLKIPFIHFSTDYVFDGAKTVPYVETDSPGPLNFYGETKLRGEQAVQEHCEKHLIFRVSWLYSEHGKNFFLTMLKLGTERQLLKIVNDQVGAPTYTAEIAKMLAQTLPEINNNWGLFHFANHGTATWYEFAKEIFAQARQNGLPLRVDTVEPIATSQYPTPATRPANSRLNTSKFESAFSYRPALWSDALSSCFSAYMRR